MLIQAAVFPRREPQTDFGFSKLRSERGSVRGAGAEDSAGRGWPGTPAPAAGGGIHGLDPALRQRVGKHPEEPGEAGAQRE